MWGRVSILTFAACLAAPVTAFAQDAAAPAIEDTPVVAANGDPWEGANRSLYAFHDRVDRAVLEPVARGYRAVAPEPVRGGVRNFLRNLRGPVVFANDVLQGEFSRAGTTAGRFVLNSTLGVAGIFDPASSAGLEHHDEDFGQTLAVWGVPAGPYIFVPLLGPSTVRDSAGRVIDAAFDPLTWAEDVDDARAGRTAATAVTAREGVIEAVEDVRATSVDPYVSIRSSYSLIRQSAIRNGRDDVADLTEFEDEISDSSTSVEPEAGAIAQQPEVNPAPAPADDLPPSGDVSTSGVS